MNFHFQPPVNINGSQAKLMSTAVVLSFFLEQRDRFGIVEDTKIYVKDMEKRLSELRKTKEESQARLEALKVAKEAKQQGMLSKAGMTASSQDSDFNVETNNCSTSQVGNNAAAPQEPAATKLWCNDVQDLCNTVSSNVDVMVDQKDGEQDFVVLVQCRSGSGAKLIGTLLRALEKLQLDVSQCSTSRSSQTYFFSAVCKVSACSESRKNLVERQ